MSRVGSRDRHAGWRSKKGIEILASKSFPSVIKRQLVFILFDKNVYDVLKLLKSLTLVLLTIDNLIIQAELLTLY